MKWPFRKSEDVNPTASPMDLLLASNCNRDEFLRLYCRLLQERVSDTTAMVTPEGTVRMVHASGKELIASIDNVWANYCRDKARRRELLERYVQAASAHILNDEEGRLEPARIVPTIRSAQFLQQRDPQHQVAREPLCGELWIVYAEESNGQIGVITMDSARKADASLADLKRHAIDNLNRILSKAQRQQLGPSHGLITAGDHTAGLLIHDKMWDEFAQTITGALVVSAPARDVLLFADSHSPDAVAELKRRTCQIAATGLYAISETLITRQGGRWEPFNAN